jgi:hypothetical protein
LKKRASRLNSFNEEATELLLYRKLAALIRRLGKFPTVPEIRLEKRNDPLFPSHNSLIVEGTENLRKELGEYCRAKHGYEDIELILSSETRPVKRKDPSVEEKSNVQYADVYLLRSGNKFKIGFSIAALSRATTINTSSAEGVQVIHIIRTDDPRG